MAAKLPEIIGIVGPIRAGKTTTTKYLVERYGYLPASNSDILRRIVQGMGLIPTRTNLALAGDSIFNVLGNDIIAKFRLSNLHQGRIVVDGIRYPDELKYYSTEPSFKLIGITAEPALRFSRTIKESKEFKDPNISQEEFDRLAVSRSEINVPGLLEKADAIIPNFETLEELHKNIDEILSIWSS